MQHTDPVATSRPGVAVAPAIGFEARPLSWRTGSEVLGLELRHGEDIAEPTIRTLWQLLGERGILLFRNQALDHDQHLNFTRRFGPLAQTGLLGKHAPPGYPDIVTVNMQGLFDVGAGEHPAVPSPAGAWRDDETDPVCEVTLFGSLVSTECQRPPVGLLTIEHGAR